MTIKKLKKYLVQFKIPLDKWGVGRAKTTFHLFKEIISGESILKEKDGKIIRVVRVLSIIVIYNDLKLKEDYQKFSDGRIRRRKMEASVAEKINGDDNDLFDSVIRAINEELQIIISKEQINHLSDIPVNRKSDSYPGIISEMMMYRFSIELNSDQFKSEGYMEDQDDKKTYFKWVKNT